MDLRAVALVAFRPSVPPAVLQPGGLVVDVTPRVAFPHPV